MLSVVLFRKYSRKLKFTKMKKSIFIALIMVLPLISFAQDDKKEESKFKLDFSGFVKNDFFWDTRQTVAAREGHFLLWPKSVLGDPDGKDINDKASFNFLSIQTRLSLGISGPDAFGAKISGKIEGDFFAQGNLNINLFRLRHAYVKMNWTNTELMFGQYWIPMFITDCFPGTVSFNTGTPIQPFGRNPQIRFTQKLGKLKLIAIASSQRDYTSRGADGVTGGYLRNSAIPELSAQIHFAKEKALVAGIGASYKQIVPQIETGQGYATNESVSSFNSIAFLKVKTSAITFKLEGVYGQNIADVLSIGGIAITDSTDLTRGFVKYSPLSTMSVWAEIHTNGKKVQVGIFGGYTKNLGSTNDVVGPIYGLGTNIESLYRVSPRIMLNSGKVRFALEGEYTVANYGSSRNIKGVPTDLTAASNMRVLFAVYYFFKK
ncbi:MAG: hypothetical protein DRI95_09415 [Bacteroidetes bacterium]|nr:MAG: hypothetical protein DRI95_09415 [Bacteroidota bacterium]